VSLPTSSELKAYLGITGSQDDARIAAAVVSAIGMAERDTGRVFSVSSNVTRYYSTDGQSSLVVHDRPYSDSTRVVTLSGVTQTEGTNVWFIPDRRNGEVTATIQLQHYDTSRPGWYKTDPYWFDKNLDHWRGYGSTPNDLAITGVEGHPDVTDDVHQGMLELAAFLYWHERGGASGFVQTPQGDQVELSSDYPEAYQQLVRNWRIRTAVSAP
jgi:hypothetical protein